MTAIPPRTVREPPEPPEARPPTLPAECNTAPSPTLRRETGARPSQSPRSRSVMKPARDDVATRAARVKQTSRIEEVIARYGVALTPSGGRHRLVGLCPFHAEEHASFTVYPETQSFCCYGCHAAGDVITFVCLIEHVRFNEALRLLGEPAGEAHMRQTVPRAGPSAPSSLSAPAATTPAVLAFPPRLRGDGAHDTREAHDDEEGGAISLAPKRENGASASLGLMLLSVTTALAMQGLVHAPSALAYLGERGISLALARRCRLGYLHDAALLDYLAGDERLVRTAREVGLLNRLHRGTLARRLIVPEIRQGRTIQLIGRALPGVQTPLPHVKYYLVCGTGEKGLLGYGAALERLNRTRRDARDATPHDGAESTTYRPPMTSRRILAPAPRALLVLEGALDYVVAVGWELPVLPVALLSAYPSRAQMCELLELREWSGGLPLLLMQDADSAGREATAHLARSLTEQQVPFDVMAPLPRLRAESPHYKDLAELGPLGRAGRAHVLAGIEQTLDNTEPNISAECARSEPQSARGREG